MMSEKRFDIIYDCQGVTRLIDRENKLISLDFGFDWNDLDNYEKDKVREWLDLLNEQQATIKKLQDLCGESDGENAKLRIENKKLKAKLREKEEDERLYANEILELRKTNEEWLQFKDLGGDY